MTRLFVFLAFLQVVAGQNGQAPPRQEAVEVAPLAPVGPSPLAPVAPVAPITVVQPAPAPMPTVPAKCINYMASMGCQWTAQWSCPGQVPYGSSGQAGVDNSHGYMCCCAEELWKYAIPTVTNPPIVNPTPPAHWKQGFTLEGIPHYIYHQKYPLMRWFEDNSQCPLNENGGFPAWIGWKSVMASGGAITTPKQGLAGNRTLQVRGFCPAINSTGFECIQEGNELKARVVGLSRDVTITLDGLVCELRDITLFKTSPDNKMGMRLDFATCVGAVDLGLLSKHMPKTASIRMDVRHKQPDDTESNLGNFFKGVCGGGAPASIFTAELPKFIYPRKPGLAPRGQPTCFAHSASSLHVMGKSCFEDFLFMDWLAPPPVDNVTGFPVFSSDPVLASIPTEDYQTLKNMIPDYQPQYHPKMAKQLLSHHTTPAPTPAPAPSPATAKVCGPSYVCQPGTHRIPGSHNKKCTGAFCQPSECCQSNTRRLAAPSQDLFKSRKLFWGLGQAKSASKSATDSPCDPQTAAPTTTEGPCATGPPATCACSKGGVMGEKFCNPFRCPPGSSLDPQAASIPCEKRTGCEKADTHRCCVLQTTTTTTWGEVPGVIVADRLCLQLSLCGDCDNDCDCVATAPNSVPLPPPPIPIDWCLHHSGETLFIGILALLLMVPISTLCCLKKWAINANYHLVDEEGYGYPGVVHKSGQTFGPEKVKKHHRFHIEMNSLAQYDRIGTNNEQSFTQTIPLDSYNAGQSEEVGVYRVRTADNSYMKFALCPTLFINFFVLAIIGFLCITLAYWPVFWIMTTYYGADLNSDYKFPICLPLLPICAGSSNAGFMTDCVMDSTVVYNPGCNCYTSLWSLGVALGLVHWWGHWVFWLSKRVKTSTNEGAGTPIMVYTGLQQVPP